MKQLLTIILFFVSVGCFAQADTVSLKQAINNLDKALLSKDTVLLKSLVDEKLEYGHSNGWIQNNRSILEDLYNGKIIYYKIERDNLSITLNGNTASVRANTYVDVEVNERSMQMKLHVLQVWIWKNNRWVLFTRQSTRP